MIWSSVWYYNYFHWAVWLWKGQSKRLPLIALLLLPFIVFKRHRNGRHYEKFQNIKNSLCQIFCIIFLYILWNFQLSNSICWWVGEFSSIFQKFWLKLKFSIQTLVFKISKFQSSTTKKDFWFSLWCQILSKNGGSS